MALNFCNNNSLSAITAIPSGISGGGLNLISTQTASSSSSLSFTSGIDSTYKEYIFKFINVHASTGAGLQFNGSTDGGSNYNVTKTTTFFRAYHNEADDGAAVTYATGGDLAQSTNFQGLMGTLGTNNDDSGCGTLHLFDPSNTTFVKHFISNTNIVESGPASYNTYVAGYMNTTSAINAVRFQMSSGNIDSGVIKLYGVS